ncbi:HAMP domain-containing protein [Paenibacillus albidus]|uniref:sensor histidine kinase n=1 Tax=Paenibacillus albidus TaxID=2041023 RepID=UPI001BE51F6F|nr:HAMP domain-containing sensor histidine kinase [Paenibacillus albidus]MBT2292819.1 HAMP domain-containing protein [Paenibacillus albidus]
MRFHRKIFLTVALTIVGISIVFITLTHFIVKSSIEAGIHEARKKEVAFLSSELSDYYLVHNQSWEEIDQIDLLQDVDRESPSLLVLDNDKREIFNQGDAPLKLITRLGVRNDIVINEKKVGQFIYYDPEVANSNKIMIGIPVSVVLALIGSGSLLIIIALFIAYQLSRWLASPLKVLLPSIERLGKGELGVQADVNMNDEYGKIANAFNRMSTELKQAEDVRRNLTADIAHELRTPLTIVGGKLDYLQQQGQPIQPETLLPIQDELIRLNRLVEDLRTLSLAEAGKLTLNKKATNLADLVQRIRLAIEPLADEKDISIQCEVHAGQTTLSVDPSRIKQVLFNLLTNAIRYTPSQGTVQIRLLNDSQHSLKIVVQDSGIGIAPEHIPHLFDRFYRADEARTRDGGGTGLGLAIAKQFVLSHQGTIEVESSLDQGTRFIIQLPY